MLSILCFIVAVILIVPADSVLFSFIPPSGLYRYVFKDEAGGK